MSEELPRYKIVDENTIRDLQNEINRLSRLHGYRVVSIDTCDGRYCMALMEKPE